MIKYLYILIFFFQFSSISQVKLTETKKLATTAKVWGFLKYYHPKVAKGRYNWDNHLFVILEKLETVNTKQALSNLFINWIDTLGTVSLFKRKDTKNAFETNFNLNWLKDSTLFTPELTVRLQNIERYRVKEKQYYVHQTPVGNVVTSNEINYSNFKWTNKQLRLLELFRYWNTINYFFPYKYQTDENWDDVLLKMIPKFNNPSSEMDYHLAMLELTVSIDDSHSALVTPLTNQYFGNKFIAAAFIIIENKALIIGIRNDSLAKIDDIQIGDVITKVNGRSIESIIESKFKYLQGSNVPSKLRRSYRAIFNGNTDSITITFIRNGITSTKKVNRYNYSEFNMVSPLKHILVSELLDNNIGYVHMGNLERKDVHNMMTEFAETKAIIFDLRHYPNSTIDLLLEHLNDKPIVFEKAIISDLNYPGKYYYKKSYPVGIKNDSPYKGQIVILINEYTQSQAEYSAMGLQTVKNSILIGSQTAGADGIVSPYNFISGYITQFSGMGIFYPNGTKTQRIGIIPDIVVKPTIKGVKNGKDEVLEKAIEYINRLQL